MEILGIGPLEFALIILIALIILGPDDMVKTGRTLGRFLRKIVTSSEWRTIQQASKEFRHLPNRLIREAGIEELKEQLVNDIGKEKNIGKQLGLNEVKHELDQWKQDISTWTTPPTQILNDQAENPAPDHNIEPEEKYQPNESEQN